MRTLAFRVWNTEHKPKPEFVYWEGFDPIIPDRIWCNYDHPVQQCTGKLDIDGNEIWEGDFIQVVYAVQSVNAPTESLGVYEVVYDQDSACWCLMVHKKNWMDREMIHDTGDQLPLLRYRNVCRVIGNVYENPELLSK